ncbi:hypothetical protein HA402_011041 [Bradysia odoriphaga]|nr:hypothetical protein HA402_011041 [Bradysia odoriphaga]
MAGILKLIHPLMSQTAATLKHPKVVELKKESFDLLIVGWFFNEFTLGLSGHFHCPSVVIFPNVNNYLMRKFAGSPNSVSTVPAPFVSSKTPMTFLQRLANFFVALMEPVMIETVDYMYNRPMYNEAFPPDIYPTFDEVVKNVSLVLLSQHFSERPAEALVPGLIEVAGMHIKKEPSPLPTEIKELLDNAHDGAIFMSLGTNVRSADLSDEKLSIFLNKFKSIKQKVVWKFETDLPNKPDNVFVSKWLPQNDILAHPNIKVFISHCGKGGVTEAKYHGVPVLGIPLFAEQLGNIDVLVAEEWALKIPFGNLNKTIFSKSLDEIIVNPKYRQRAQKLSALYRDRPEHPLDKAAFWIEYVIRHNGAKHMQSSAVHLNIFQYYMVDVVAFLFVVLVVGVKIFAFICKKLKAKIFGVNKVKTS